MKTRLLANLCAFALCVAIFSATIFGAIFFVACDGEKVAEIGKIAPEIVAMDMEGKSANLVDFSDKAIALVFFKNGCEACVGILPPLDSYAKTAPNLAVIAINAHNSKDEIAEFLAEVSLPHTQILRDSLKLTTQRFIITMTPSVVLLDRNHIVREKIIGAGDFGAIEAKLQTLL